MLDYEWTNPSHLLIPTEVDHPIPTPTPTHHHPFPDPFDFPFDPRALPSASFPPPPSNFPGSPPNFFFIPKPEPDFSGISLNLGGRTYFSAATDEDFVNRLYHRRSRATEGGVGHVPAVVRCQAEGCNADLSNAKHYHRRHKVCEFHSKAASVVAGGLTQRFCQQCSRFHLLAEFDNGKRSCRRRLADHNRRRRKSHQSAANPDRCNALTENPHHSSHSDSFQSSPSDSGANLSSTVTIAVSPQAEYGKKAAYNTTASFTVSSSPIFYSSGH